MTPLNNQELKKKTDELMKRLGWEYKPNKGGTYYWQKFDGVHKSQMTLTEARLLTELFESELANRERVARIDELRKIRIKQFDSSQGDYELGWNELRHELRCHIKDRLAQLKNNTTKQEDIKDE